MSHTGSGEGAGRFSRPLTRDAFLFMGSSSSAQVVRLRVPTFTSTDALAEHAPECIDPYICTCVPHSLDRDRAIARGVRPDLPAPWQPKPPRALRGAAA